MKKIWLLIRETLTESKQDNLAIFAAGFSYYLLFSIIPLMIVVFAVAGKIIETRSASNAMVAQLALLFDAEVASSFKAILVSASKVKVSKVGGIGFVMVVYGASRIFSVLLQAISQIWDKEEKRKGGIKGAVTARLHSAALLIVPIVLVLVCFMMDTLFSAFKHTFGIYFSGVVLRYVLPTVAHLFSLGLFASVFALINRFLPLRKPSWSDVWVGAVVTTVVFALVRLVFTTSFHLSHISSLFGAAGSVILVLMWIYFSMLIFLYGSELTRVYTRKHGSWKFLGV